MQITKTKFIVGLMFLLAAGFAATSLLSYFVASNSLSEQISERSLPLTSDNIYSEIQNDLIRPVFVAKMIAENTFVREWMAEGELNPSQIEEYLHNVQANTDTFTAFFISDRSRRYYHSSGRERFIYENDPKNAWYFRAQGLENDYEVVVDEDEMSNGTLTIFINYRVLDREGKFIGVAGVGVALDTARRLIEEYKSRFERRVYFIDRTGHFVIGRSENSSAVSIYNDLSLAPFATRLLTNQRDAFEYKRNRRPILLNSRFIEPFGWHLIVEEDAHSAEADILKTLFINLVSALLIMCVVLGVAYFTFGGYQRRLEEMATSDALTGALTRNAFDLVSEQTIRSAGRRGDTPLSLILFDLDHFKSVNDTYGHHAGDKVLQGVADVVRGKIRSSDVFCRWGGEEFLLLLPDCDVNAARILAGKLRAAIGDLVTTVASASISVTISAGIAERVPDEEVTSMIKRADAALYLAKAAGRDKVKIGEVSSDTI